MDARMFTSTLIYAALTILYFTSSTEAACRPIIAITDPICQVTYSSDDSTEYRDCYDPKHQLKCVHDGLHTSRGFSDVHRCTAREGQVVDPLYLMRSNQCSCNTDCIAGMMCCQTDCLVTGEKVCQPWRLCKVTPVCEVDRIGKSALTSACVDSDKVVCRPSDEPRIVDIASISRCTQVERRCDTDADCTPQICLTDSGKCLETWETKVSPYLMPCDTTEDCIGPSEKCCFDTDLPQDDFYYPRVCRPADDCERGVDGCGGECSSGAVSFSSAHHNKIWLDDEF